MKFNWGTGITIFIVLFVVSMSAMVFKASQQNVDLVTEDYYEKELAFQDLKDKEALVLSHFEEQISYKIENDKLQLIFPSKVEGEVKGNIVFFKPSDARLDQSVDFISESKTLVYPLNLFSTGMYKLRIEWQNAGNAYYSELTVKL